jgi:hypothetical protein
VKDGEKERAEGEEEQSNRELTNSGEINARSRSKVVVMIAEEDL